MERHTTQRLLATPQTIADAAAILREGGLIAMPTETVYGLAANALNAVAVAAIFEAKQRPQWDPLIVHVASAGMLGRVTTQVPKAARQLADAFWPGPLTMLLPRSSEIGDIVTAGRPLVGVRWPKHPVAQALIHAADLPLAAPSANRFGHISPSSAAHVLADLDGRIDAVLDAGPCDIGIESTVLDPNTTPITIYRQGAVSSADVERVTGLATHIFQAAPSENPQSLPSPGTGIRHYAPSTTLRLVSSQEELKRERGDLPFVTEMGVLLPDGWHAPPDAVTERWGAWDDTVELAHNLYQGLRSLDAKSLQILVAPLPDLRAGDDLRVALRDRLLKAAMPAQA